MQSNPNDVLRAAGRYVREFRGRIFVIKIGGDVLADAAARRGVCEQLSLLWAFSIPLVVVHGVGPQLDDLCRRLDLAVAKHGGRRRTDAAVLSALKMAVGAVQLDLLADLRAAGVSAVGLSGLDARMVTARRRPAADIDWGFVGDIERVDPTLLRELTGAGRVPVVAPVTGDDAGGAFNTNADTLAAALAGALGAEKLFFVMRAPGLLADPDNAASLIPAADLELLREMEESGVLRGGMLPKADALRRALDAGVRAVHLVSGFAPDAILTEVFTNEGSGTMLTRVAAAEPEYAQ